VPRAGHIRPLYYYSDYTANLICCRLWKVSAFNKAAAPMEAWSEEVTTMSTTFQLPSDIELSNVTASSLTVSWTSPSDNSIHQHRLEYRQVIQYIPLYTFTPQPGNTGK